VRSKTTVLRVCCTVTWVALALTAQCSDTQNLAAGQIREGQRLQQEGRLNEAEQLLTRALRDAQNHDHESVQVAVISDNLASVYEDLGRYFEAEGLYAHSVSILENATAVDAEVSIIARSHLASIYLEMGQLSKAEGLVRRDLEIEERRLGPDHVSIADLRERLGTVYGLQRRYADAESIFRNALEIFQRQLASNDPRIAMALTNLACVIAPAGRHAEATSYAEQSWRILNARSDANPATVIKTLTTLGVLASITGCSPSAASYLERALQRAESSYGPNHPLVAYVLGNFAACMRRCHNGNKARPMEARAKSILSQSARDNNLGYSVDIHTLLPSRVTSGHDRR
jgi:tetratricopeptide (TPR) repeat protein